MTSFQQNIADVIIGSHSSGAQLSFNGKPQLFVVVITHPHFPKVLCWEIICTLSFKCIAMLQNARTCHQNPHLHQFNHLSCWYLHLSCLTKIFVLCDLKIMFSWKEYYEKDIKLGRGLVTTMVNLVTKCINGVPSLSECLLNCTPRNFAPFIQLPSMAFYFSKTMGEAMGESELEDAVGTRKVRNMQLLMLNVLTMYFLLLMPGRLIKRTCIDSNLSCIYLSIYHERNFMTSA